MAHISQPSTIPEPLLTLPNNIIIRPYHHSDAEAIAPAANNRKIWLNMTELFPHPYTLDDAKEWIEMTFDHDKSWHSTASPPDPSNRASLIARNYCIVYSGLPIGGIGLNPKKGSEHSRTTEFGYWIGEEFWGKGIATLVATAFTKWIFDTFPWFIRLQATVYGWNKASMAVLRKCGYEFEGIQKCAIWKDGKVTDLYIFTKVRPGVHSTLELN